MKESGSLDRKLDRIVQKPLACLSILDLDFGGELWRTGVWTWTACDGYGTFTDVHVKPKIARLGALDAAISSFLIGSVLQHRLYCTEYELICNILT